MKKSFTLIEILVVATIIVLLTATASVTYTAFLKQSRDAKRKVDLGQISAALEMYRSNNDTYPASTNLTILTSPVTYIKSIPKDPKTNGDYGYSALPVDCQTCTPSPCIPTVACASYALTADLEAGGIYTAGPYGSSTVTPTPTPTP